MLSNNCVPIQNKANQCQRILLELVAGGCALITEIQSLVDSIPEPFKNNYEVNHGRNGKSASPNKFNRNNLTSNTNSQTDKNSLDKVISDFSYFKNMDLFEKRIESNNVTKKLDQYLCQNHSEILTQFYLAFDAVRKYADDLNNFVKDLDEKSQVGYALESFLSSLVNRQLLSEAYYILGYLLIMIDSNFEGDLRERLLVSYYRYSCLKASANSTLEHTFDLFRSTGFRCAQQQVYKGTGFVGYNRPANYPESLLRRVKVNSSIVNLLIAKVQFEDLYDLTTTAFPNPEHRSTALSRQAAMVYVMLFFCPNILNEETSRMRQITDKFFYDNWILNLHMGDLCNIIESWHPYKAARESLLIFDDGYVRNLIANQNISFNQVSKHLQELLIDGRLNEKTILNDCDMIFNVIRKANVSLRWMLLQSSYCPFWQVAQTKHIHMLLTNEIPSCRRLCQLLHDLAKLENEFKIKYQHAIQTKELTIQCNKSKASEILCDLIEIFADIKLSRWVPQGSNGSLVSTFEQVKESLPETKDSHSIVRLINDIEYARETHFDGRSMQVVQLFESLKESMLNIMTCITLNVNYLSALKTVSDMGYAWCMMNQVFLKYMQTQIRNSPLILNQLNYCFEKFSTAYDSHLLRLENVDADTSSLRSYYSNKLINFTKQVLHIIPTTIMDSIEDIVRLRSDQDRLNHGQANADDQLTHDDVRLKLLELTHKISNYTESMIEMQHTNNVKLEFDARESLMCGLRQELAVRLGQILDSSLDFNINMVTLNGKRNKSMSSSYDRLLHKVKMIPVQFSFQSHHNSMSLSEIKSSLVVKLDKLEKIMCKYWESFECIQDKYKILSPDMLKLELFACIKNSVGLANDILMQWINESTNHNSVQDNCDSITIYSAQQLMLSSASVSSTTSSVQSSPESRCAIESSLKENFMYRLLMVIMNLTDPCKTVYNESLGAWFDPQDDHSKVMDTDLIGKISKSLGVAGLNGLDELCSTLLSIEVRGSISACSGDGEDCLLRIGQLQAIRAAINFNWAKKCRFEARNHYFNLINADSAKSDPSLNETSCN